ncbi:ECF transporter S component [Candidatus Bipolaricaulota bacterium]|nr:ECF transporter S component [Candidatus Bipolaricaulota bacterium]
MKNRVGTYLMAGVALIIVVLSLVLAGSDSAGSARGAVISAGVASMIVIGFVTRFETSGVRAREIAVIALLGTLAALLRVPFAAIPGLQPSTYIVICSGYVFGPVAGFMVGAMTALVSNFFLGQGPWTLFQVVAWGLAGASAPLLRVFVLKGRHLSIFGFVWGVVFGIIMNVWMWVAFVYPLTARTFMITWLNSLWFDGVHAVGNALFLGLLGVQTVRVLERYHRRFYWIHGDADEEQLRPSESDVSSVDE